MFIKEIELHNFRNYKEERISFNEKVNIFLGKNAQGKTNLLEGIYLNAFGKSFKKVQDKDLIKFGEDYCKIKTIFVSDDEEKTTETAIRKDGKKGIKKDGVKIKKSSEILDRIYIIVFSPEDLKIVKEDPEKRRNFIDRELCQIRAGYLADLIAYKKVLKQRNVCLKDEVIDRDLLSVWDIQLEEYGSKIIDKRKEFIKRINIISREIHSQITGGEENLELKYEPNYFSSDEIENDIRNRTTCKGPHRDDFKISADGIDLRKYISPLLYINYGFK